MAEEGGLAPQGLSTPLSLAPRPGALVRFIFLRILEIGAASLRFPRGSSLRGRCMDFVRCSEQNPMALLALTINNARMYTSSHREFALLRSLFMQTEWID